MKLAANGGGVTSRFAVRSTPLKEAVITAVAVELTLEVETVKFAVAPETLTLLGTVAAALLLLRLTVTGVEGVVFNVTVP